MSLILRQSTAVVVSFGPFVDKTDGVTPETGLVSAIDHASTGILLSKNGGALTIRHASVTASTYDAYGNYRVTLDTTDTNTIGTLRMQFIETATCLPVWQDLIVVDEAVWDALFGTTALATATNITAGTITTVTNLTNAPGAGDFTATMKTSIGTAVAASAVASVTGNVGGNVTGTVGSVVGAVGSVTGAVGSVTGAVGSVTGNVGGNVVGSVGSVTAEVTANVAKINSVAITGDGSGTPFNV